MGMFDSLLIKCPHCGAFNEEQDKSGPCLLKIYSLEDAPGWLVQNCSNYPIYCHECGKQFKLVSNVVEKIEYEVKKI